MARAYSNALLAYLNRESVVGIYAKGSAYRRWDSIIDYVPELSDVDVHVRVRGAGWGQAFQHAEQAMEIGERARRAFTLLHPDPVHTPRPQVSDLTGLEASTDYLPSPPETVYTLFGERYTGADRAAYRSARMGDGEALLETADFVEKELPAKLVDRPGSKMWDVVARLTWRMGPTGPRMLTQLGVDPYDAWSMNRTAVVRSLRALRRDDLSETYASFYRAGWEGFRSRFQDVDAAREAIMACDRLLRLARRLVRGLLP